MGKSAVRAMDSGGTKTGTYGSTDGVDSGSTKASKAKKKREISERAQKFGFEKEKALEIKRHLDERKGDSRSR